MAGSDRASVRKLASALYAAGAVTLVVGIVLALLFGAVYLLIAAFALIDFALARMYETGRIAPPAAARRGDAGDDPAASSESDPGYNPYARED